MENKALFAVICILLNQFGVPCFMQGKTKTAIVQLVSTLLFPWVFAPINFVLGVIVGIEIFQMSDEDYNAKKGTFIKAFPELE